MVARSLERGMQRYSDPCSQMGNCSRIGDGCARSAIQARSRCHLITFHYTRNLTRIPVHTPSRAYEVLVERGLLRSAAAALRDVIPRRARACSR